MFRSIKTKFLVAQLGFILFMAVALGLVSYFIMFRSLRSSRLQYLEYAAMATEERVNLLIESKEQLLEKIATSDPVTNYARKRSENILVGYFGRFMSEFDVLAFVNDQGIGEVELINGEIPAKILCEANSVLIERLRKNPNKTLNEYVTFCPDVNGPSVEFGFFHRSFFDEFVGVVLGEVSAVELFKNIQKSRIGETGSVILLDSEGTILSCRDTSNVLQKMVIEGDESENAVLGIKAGWSGLGRAKIMGVDSYFAYAPAYEQNWIVMTVLPYEEFAAALSTLRYTVFAVSLNVLAAGSVLSWLLARKITGPILKLLEGTSLIAKGDFSHKIRITSQDEVGTLTRSFNQMAEDLGKTTTSIINLNREIAERRKIEASLIKSEKRFEEVAENSGDWIWEVNTEGLYTYSSPVVEKVLGYKAEEIVGKKYFYDFFAPDTKEELKKTAFEAFAKRESFRGFINFNIHKNGGTVVLETNGTPIVDGEGNLYGYRGADRDITERKRAEETICEKSELYRALFEQANDAIFLMENEYFVDCNERTLEMFGVTREQIINQSPTRFSPEFQADGQRSARKAMEKIHAAHAGEPQFFEWTHTQLDGTSFDTEVSLSLIKISGRPLLQAIVRDITERKRAEGAIRNLNKDLEMTIQQLNRSNKELREFAYIAAHDLKTPLRAIGTLADWLLTDYADKFDEQGKEKIELLVGRARRIDKLVDSILEYSEIEHTGQKKQEVDLNLLLSKIIGEIGPSDSIEITIENELPAIMSNKRLIRQVFGNLLSNAVKYMDKPKGQIRISCREDDDFWTFSVSDNGPGIEQRYFEKIFKIFQTLATHDEVEAVGIGLSLTKKIVELYGGRVWVQSEPGQGSTFYFTLPKQEMRVKDALCEANIVS